jgi:hypothetical protein
VVVQSVPGWGKVVLLAGDMYDVALITMEAHVPGVFPAFEGLWFPAPSFPSAMLS